MPKRIVTVLICVCTVFLLCQSDLYSQGGQTVPAVPGGQGMGPIIQLNIFRCHNQDESGCDEPYIWVIYFKVDGQTVDLTNLSTLARSSTTIYIPHRTITDHSVHPPKTTVIGSHDNLGKTCVKKGDNFAIPKELGPLQSNLVPIKGLGTNKFALVGVIVYALEEDDASEGEAERVRKLVTERIIDELNNAIRSLPLNPNPNTIRETIEHRIWQKVLNTHLAPADYDVIFVDDDTFIGANIAIKTYKDFETQESIPFALQFKGKTAFYEIAGTMNYKVPKPRITQAQPVPKPATQAQPVPNQGGQTAPSRTTTTVTRPVTTTTILSATTTVICRCPDRTLFDNPFRHCISGRVKNSAGQPLAGEKVILKMAEAEREWVKTDSNGCYIFSNLEDGTYKIKVKNCTGGGSQTRRITLVGMTDTVNSVNFECE